MRAGQLANEYMVPMLQRKVECRLTQHIVLDDALMLLDAAMAFNGNDELTQAHELMDPCSRSYLVALAPLVDAGDRHAATQLARQLGQFVATNYADIPEADIHGLRKLDVFIAFLDYCEQLRKSLGR